MVVRSVLGDQRNPSISSFKQGNFRLGELYRICMLLVVFVACTGFHVVNYVLKMREIGGCGFWILLHWNWS